jgi:RimJ/RimL family protein N-acetyltransferase
MGFVKNGLCFREVEESDLVFLRQWRNDPKMSAGWSDPISVQSPRQQEAWYSTLNRYNQAFVVEDKTAKVGLLRFKLEPETRRAALTGTDVAREYQGKGYGKRILRAGAEYVLFDLGYHRVTAEALDTNLAAQKIIESCGFKIEGTLRGYMYRNGDWRNWYIYGLLEGEL